MIALSPLTSPLASHLRDLAELLRERELIDESSLASLGSLRYPLQLSTSPYWHAPVTRVALEHAAATLVTELGACLAARQPWTCGQSLAYLAARVAAWGGPFEETARRHGFSVRIDFPDVRLEMPREGKRPLSVIIERRGSESEWETVVRLARGLRRRAVNAGSCADQPYSQSPTPVRTTFFRARSLE